MNMEEKLLQFLQQYLGRGETKADIVTEEAIEILVREATFDGIEQDIIDYGTENPDAPFWDFLKMLKPGLYGVTQEELLRDDDEGDED